jgi:hypothetical protein
VFSPDGGGVLTTSEDKTARLGDFRALVGAGQIEVGLELAIVVERAVEVRRRCGR